MKTKKAKKSTRPKASSNSELGKPLSIAKIRELYHGESVAVHLTKIDRHYNPIGGIVVAHSKNDDELLRQAEEYRSKNPKAKLYTFVAGSYFPEGVAVVLNIRQ